MRKRLFDHLFLLGDKQCREALSQEQDVRGESRPTEGFKTGSLYTA